MSVLDTLDRALGHVTRAGSVLSSSVLMLTMMASIADSVGRWVLLPLQGVFELNALLIGIVIFLGIPYAQRQRRHIAVTLLVERLGPRAALWLDLAMLVIASALFGWSAVLFHGAAVSAYVNQEVAQGVSRFPLFPLKFVMFLGLSFLAVQLALDALLRLRQARGGPPARGSPADLPMEHLS